MNVEYRIVERTWYEGIRQEQLNMSFHLALFANID